MGYNNKFYKIYKKQIGLWMHSIFSNTKIKKYKVLRIRELWLIKAIYWCDSIYFRDK